MKHYVNETDTLLQTRYSARLLPGNNRPKHGDLVPHGTVVEWAILKIPVRIGREEYYKDFYLTRDVIMELAKKIRELEEQVENIPFDEIPF